MSLSKYRYDICDLRPALKEMISLESRIRLINVEMTQQGELAPHPSIEDRTRAIVDGLCIVLEHHKAPLVVRQQLKNQLHGYLDNAPNELEWSARAKHMLASQLNRYLRNPRVLQSFPDFKPTGGLRRWMRVRLNAFNRKNTHLWYSWFQGKRCALPASESLVDLTYRKHLKTLTSPDKGNADEVDRILGNPIFQQLLQQVRSDVKLHFRAREPLEETPSTKACWERSRANGGSFAELKAKALSPNQRDDGVRAPFGAIGEFSELLRMDHFPVVQTSNGPTFNVVLEKRISMRTEDWQRLEYHMSTLDLSTDVKLPAMIQGVLEPLKVRVISKGPSLNYYSSKSLQKALHTALRGMKCFRLIGQEFCPTMVCDLLKKAHRTWKWFSVDYSAATDGLSWLYAGRIFQIVIGALPIEEQLRAMQVLGPHELRYPRGVTHGICEKHCSGKKEIKAGLYENCEKCLLWGQALQGLQQSGQLMGSPLSFPILCLANMGVYLEANKSMFVNWSYEEILDHVLVNGDDMLYAAPADHWARHVEVGRNVGLEMSPGKAYVHSVYANVNSVSIHCAIDMKEKGATPWKVGFLNTGLLKGQHKVQGRSHDPTEITTCELEQITFDQYLATKGKILKWMTTPPDDPDRPVWDPFKATPTETAAYRQIKYECVLTALGDRIQGMKDRKTFQTSCLSQMDAKTTRSWEALFGKNKIQKIENINSYKNTNKYKSARDWLGFAPTDNVYVAGMEPRYQSRKAWMADLASEKRRWEGLDPLERMREHFFKDEIDFDSQAQKRLIQWSERQHPNRVGNYSVLNEVLDGCLPGGQISILRLFLKLHKDELLKECSILVKNDGEKRRNRLTCLTRNLFLPISSGGMGVVPPLGWKYKVTEAQKMFFLLNAPIGHHTPRGSPLPGYPVDSFLPYHISPCDNKTAADLSFIDLRENQMVGYHPELKRRRRDLLKMIKIGYSLSSHLRKSTFVRRAFGPLSHLLSPDGTSTNPSRVPSLPLSREVLPAVTIDDVYYERCSRSRSPSDWSEDCAIHWTPLEVLNPGQVKRSRVSFSNVFSYDYEKGYYLETFKNQSFAYAPPVKDLTRECVEKNPGPAPGYWERIGDDRLIFVLENPHQTRFGNAVFDYLEGCLNDVSPELKCELWYNVCIRSYRVRINTYVIEETGILKENNPHLDDLLPSTTEATYLALDHKRSVEQELAQNVEYAVQIPSLDSKGTPVRKSTVSNCFCSYCSGAFPWPERPRADPVHDPLDIARCPPGSPEWNGSEDGMPELDDDGDLPDELAWPGWGGWPGGDF